MYGIIFANFALSNTIRDSRAEYARLSPTTGFFYAVKSTLYKELRLPNLTASFLRKVRLACLLYCFNDKGGSRFLFCLQLKQYKMSKSTIPAPTPAQLIEDFNKNYLNAKAAAAYAKSLRLTAMTALETSGEVDLNRVVDVLYLSELMQDISNSYSSLSTEGVQQ